MSETEIRDAVRRSINALRCEPRPLDFASVHECSTAHRLALHLEAEFFPQWDIDCEYNRREEEIKRLSILGENNEDAIAKVRPDIIVHRRKLCGAENNLLIVELKRQATDDRHDTNKLKEFTRTPGEFEYQHGLYISIQNGIFACTWFKDGDERRIGSLVDPPITHDILRPS